MADLVRVDADIKAATRDLTRLQRQQIPFAASVAINNLAVRGQVAIRGDMQHVFDRPTRYTLSGTFVARSNKRVLVATVGLIDKPRRGNRAPAKYLAANISGGTRGLAGYEVALRSIGALPSGWRAVPAAGVKLDRYGNMARTELAEILGALKSGLRVAAGRGKRAHLRGYFVALPGSRRTAHLHPGVWRRIERSGAGSAIQPVLLFVQRTDYSARLDIGAAVRKQVRLHVRDAMAAALDYALETAR